MLNKSNDKIKHQNKRKENGLGLSRRQYVYAALSLIISYFSLYLHG